MTRLNFVRSRLLAPPPRAADAIVFIGLAIVVPTLLRVAIDGLVTGTTFVAYYPFVLISAMFMGWRHASVVALGSAIVANFLFMAPRYTVFAGPDDISGAVSFLCAAMVIILLAEAMRRTAAELEAIRKHGAHLERELQHRVRNMMSVIQGLAVQSFRDANSEPDLRKFQDRLRALAHANDILSCGRWQSCFLPELAVRALEPFNGRGSINLFGPACTLADESCVPLMLALHELATNALKYGALSVPGGSVDVTWTICRDAACTGHDLVLEWAERDGPPVEEPERRGLGTRLLRKQPGIEDVELTFPAYGVNCRFHVKGAKALPQGQDELLLGDPDMLHAAETPAQALQA